MSRFEGKAGIITGGGTGIGRSIAEGIVSDGGKVLIVGRREEPLKELASKYDGTVAYMQGDVGDNGIAAEIVERAVLEFGRVDFVVNNAAAAEVVPLVLTSDEVIDRTMRDQPEAVEMLMQQTALRRSAHPDEVARTVLWLLSEDAGSITGQIIQSSGGLMLA